MELILDIILAFVGGIIGASIGALGGFVLFGVLGIVGYLSLFFAESDIWLTTLTSEVVFMPSVCFIGGAVATGYTRRLKLIECGKDIGRSLISIGKIRVIAVGGFGGVAGFFVTLFFNTVFKDKLDTVALTVVIVPLFLKYIWGLTKTNDCEGSSHVVPSPYRFFEKLSTWSGKVITALVVAVLTVTVTAILAVNPQTLPYSGSLMFFISALSLYLLFFQIPIPATHHFSGPTGIVTIEWFLINGVELSLVGVLVPVLWGVAISLVALLASDIVKRNLFDEGDIHVDPPAGGIVVATVLGLWIVTKLDIFYASVYVQVSVSFLMSSSALLISYLIRDKKSV